MQESFEKIIVSEAHLKRSLIFGNIISILLFFNSKDQQDFSIIHCIIFFEVLSMYWNVLIVEYSFPFNSFIDWTN